MSITWELPLETQQRMGNCSNSFGFLDFNEFVLNINPERKMAPVVISEDVKKSGLSSIVRSRYYTNLEDTTMFFLENHIKLNNLKGDLIMADVYDIKIINEIIEHLRYKMLYLESYICRSQIPKSSLQSDLVDATAEFRKYLQMRHDFISGVLIKDDLYD